MRYSNHACLSLPTHIVFLNSADVYTLHCINSLSLSFCVLFCLCSQHFSISNAGDDLVTSTGSTDNAHVQVSKEDTGATSEEGKVVSGRRFTEGPHPVVSSSSEKMSIGDRGGNSPPSQRKGVETGGGGKGDSSVSGEFPDVKKEVSEKMKAPSLPPPSRLKETAATMPPPPSLPPRFVKGEVKVMS